MIPFLEFIEKIDKDKPDFAGDLKGTPRRKRDPISSATSLNDEEQAYIDQQLQKYRIQLKNERWEKVLLKNLRYKRPAILNLDAQELEHPDSLYVLPIFIKSGKQNMLFKMKDYDLETCDWMFERDIVDIRIEDIAHFTKDLKSQ